MRSGCYRLRGRSCWPEKRGDFFVCAHCGQPMGETESEARAMRAQQAIDRIAEEKNAT